MLTQGGDQARKARSVLPWAIIFSPFGTCSDGRTVGAVRLPSSRIDTRSYRALEDLEVGARGEAAAGPECCAGVVVSIDKDIALEDALLGERAKAGVDELAAEAAMAEFGDDCQVMQIAAAAVVTAEDGGDDGLLAEPTCRLRRAQSGT